MQRRRKPEIHDGYLNMGRFSDHFNRDRRKPVAGSLNRGFWVDRRLTTVSSEFASREATHQNRDRRIPVLPELPKLEKRVRLPSVALEDKSPHAAGFLFMRH